MNSHELLLKILGEINEVAQRTVRIETKVEMIERDVARIKEEDAEQNKLLDEHIAGVKTNRERLNNEVAAREALEARLASLEVYPQTFSTLKTMFMWIGAFLGPISILLGIIYTISNKF